VIKGRFHYIQADLIAPFAGFVEELERLLRLRAEFEAYLLERGDVE
jgi:hypothetical protein